MVHFILVLPAIRYLSCMAIKFADDNLKLSEVQLESIEHFVADYNAIDHFFRKALCLDEQVPFARMVSQYSKQNTGWRDADLLKTIAKVRNVIVRGKTQPYCYPAVPSPELAQNLKACLKRLTNPALAIPVFQREVVHC